MSTKTRKVITRSGARVRRLFYSQKSHAHVACESHLEFRACTIAEFIRSIAVLAAHQQQVTIGVSEDQFDAYPDLCFSMSDGTSKIVEVKSDSELKDDRVISRLTAIQHHFESIGTMYEVWSETFIDQEPRRSTLEELLYYRKPITHLSYLAKPEYHELKRRHSTVRFIEAADYLGGCLSVRKCLANGLLSADYTLPLTDLTPVTVH